MQSVPELERRPLCFFSREFQMVLSGIQILQDESGQHSSCKGSLQDGFKKPRQRGNMWIIENISPSPKCKSKTGLFKTVNQDSGDLVSVPSSTTNLLCDVGQVTQPHNPADHLRKYLMLSTCVVVSLKSCSISYDTKNQIWK